MAKKRSHFAGVAVFCLLVAIGVVGRWGQPEWCVTPMAATGLLAGRYFGRFSIAMLVPLTAMALSDLVLAGYDHTAVLVAVYLAMALSALWGRALRRPAASRLAGAARWACCAAAPAVGFFLITNFAVWASTGWYPKGPIGLVECYAAALPFFRQMLAGDLVYTGALFGLAAMAGVFPTVARREVASIHAS